MKSNVRKWGNSPAVRISAPLLAAAGLRIDQRIEVRADETGIHIVPVAETFDLAAALAAITPDNLHDEADFGGAVGNEAW